MTLGSPRLELGSNPRVTALLSGRRATVLTLAVAPLTDATGVTLERTGASLTIAAAKTIARRLQVASLPRINFATVTAVASFPAAGPTVGPSAPALPGACRSTTEPGAAPTPPKGEPPVKPAPAGVLGVASATISWHPRTSFVRYINSGEGTDLQHGATGEPPTVESGTPAPLVYWFPFTLDRRLVRSGHGVDPARRSEAPSPSATKRTASTCTSTTPRSSSTGPPRASSSA